MRWKVSCMRDGRYLVCEMCFIGGIPCMRDGKYLVCEICVLEVFLECEMGGNVLLDFHCLSYRRTIISKPQ